MKSTSPCCNSLIGYLLKWRCCSLVWPQSLLSKTGFDLLGSDQSSFRLSALHKSFVFLQESNLWHKRVISLLLCAYVSLLVCLCTVLLYISVCISQFESGSGDKIWGIQSWEIICQIKIHTDKSCRLTTVGMCAYTLHKVFLSQSESERSYFVFLLPFLDVGRLLPRRY